MVHTKTILRRLVLTLFVLAASAVTILGAESVDAFYQELEDHLRAQDATFTISYNGDSADLGLDSRVSFGALQRTLMARSPDGPDSADYYALNVDSAAVTNTDGVYAFDMGYLCTKEQLAEVDRQVPEIIRSLELEGMDDEAKIKLVYEYVCTHFVYDNTETKYSAYDGLTSGSMVCQGYALLLSKLMWEADIPCRIIAGRSQNQTHAWNTVKLNGMWYNLDSTWDGADDLDKPMKWTFFLKSQADFEDHVRFAEMDTEEYHASHPVAEESHVLRRIILQSNGQEVVNLVVRQGIPVQLDAILPEGENGTVTWTSSDPETLSAGESGELEGFKRGGVILTAEAADLRSVIPAKVSVYVVDLTEASPWAQETVTRYYLNQLLPYEMCCDFKQELTRGELAYFCYYYVFRVQGWEPATLRNPFSDLEGDPFAVQILRCNDVGIMTGVAKDRFQPEGTVTREQAAAVLSRLIAYLTGSAPQATGEPNYQDAGDLSDWARECVAAVSENGIFRGADGLFRPKDSITRQEMILTFDRVFTNYPVEKDEPELDAA